MDESYITTSSKPSWSRTRLLKFLTRVFMAVDRRAVRFDIQINVVRTPDMQAHEDRLHYVRHLERENAYLESILRSVGIDPNENLSVSRIREIEEKMR